MKEHLDNTESILILCLIAIGAYVNEPWLAIGTLAYTAIPLRWRRRSGDASADTEPYTAHTVTTANTTPPNRITRALQDAEDELERARRLR